jgi:hypothetical protein
MARTGRKPYETTEIVPFGVENRRLQPPDCLGELQKRAFLDLVTSCPISQFRRSDLALLCRWSELTVMAETAAFELQQGGMVVIGKEGPKVSPWFAIHRDATRELRALSQRLQIGPRGRTWSTEDKARDRLVLRTHAFGRTLPRSGPPIPLAPSRDWPWSFCSAPRCAAPMSSSSGAVISAMARSPCR